MDICCTLCSRGHLHTMARQFFRWHPLETHLMKAQQRFLRFCSATKSCLIPPTGATITLFAAYLASTNLSYTTIKVCVHACQP